MKVYENPGCHAVATFEMAVEEGFRAGYPIAIMECPRETPYDTGWHRITLDSIDYWERQGYVLRAVLRLHLEVL